jgi:hypothetical protein
MREEKLALSKAMIKKPKAYPLIALLYLCCLQSSLYAQPTPSIGSEQQWIRTLVQSFTNDNSESILNSLAWDKVARLLLDDHHNKLAKKDLGPFKTLLKNRVKSSLINTLAASDETLRAIIYNTPFVQEGMLHCPVDVHLLSSAGQQAVNLIFILEQSPRETKLIDFVIDGKRYSGQFRKAHLSSILQDPSLKKLNQSISRRLKTLPKKQ